jgi:anti-sigma-K factor RskA
MSDFDDLRDPGADAETLALEKRSLPPVTPPADLFDRILAEVKPQAVVVPLRTRSRRRVLVPLAAGLTAVAAVAVLALVLSGGGGRPADATAAITGKSDPAVRGVAVLHGSTADGGTVHVSLDDVPPAPGGHHYEIWVLRQGGKEMEAVGAFAPASSHVELDLPLPGPGDYAAVDVSVEDDGGSPAHSDTSLAGGTFS